MKFVRFVHDGVSRWGAATEFGILDLTRAYAARLAYAGEPEPYGLAEAVLPPEPKQFFARGDLALEQAADTLRQVQAAIGDGQTVSGPLGEKILFQPDEIQWLPPVIPEKFLAIGLNYEDHVRETGKQIPEHPLLFSKLPSCIIGHGQAIILPVSSRRVDYEAELGVVIGRSAKRVSRTEAWDVVAGFTIVNDVTARDHQHLDGQWTRGKGLDTFGPLGPVIVTKDEIADPANLPVRLWLNEQLMQDSNTRHLIFDIPTLIEYISQDITLSPGDVIATGTPPGVGVARKPPVYLQDGDVVTIEIEGIGRLINPVKTLVR